MRIFVINLEKDTQKRDDFVKNFSRFSLDYEFINGIYGGGISESELFKLVYDYKNCFLTKGEIGCALSHLKIYQKMIDENIPYALILEDDAGFSDEFCEILAKIDEFLSKKDDFELVCLMQLEDACFKNLTIKIDKNLRLYKFSSGFRTHGYIITKTAAAKLLKLNTPIILESDMWLQFYELSGLKIYTLSKDVIFTTDKDGANSSIGTQERLNFAKQKAVVRKQKMKKIGGISYCFRRILQRLRNKIFTRIFTKR
ncbi:glycosyltransferase family 25 protein [Campylobacter mucosalis]|uniref:glycosyltransferase family 25 protein n=1 Tax=Campylobacter mucosalis TaxID=202 RepID=UPI00146FD50E